MSLQKIDDPLTQRIVHRTVKIVATDIGTSMTIADLAGGIFPDFTNQNAIIIAVQIATNGPQKIIRQLISHVQPPAINSQIIPFRQDTAPLAIDELLIAGIVLIDRWQIINSPPAVILIRVMLKIEPFIIRAVFVISRTGLLAVEMTSVEIAAVFAYVIEDAIQDQMHIVFMQHRD